MVSEAPLPHDATLRPWKVNVDMARCFHPGRKRSVLKNRWKRTKGSEAECREIAGGRHAGGHQF